MMVMLYFIITAEFPFIVLIRHFIFKKNFSKIIHDIIERSLIF